MALSVAACGTSDSGGNAPTPQPPSTEPPGTDPPTPPSSTSPDAASPDVAPPISPPSEWTTLISGDWSMPTGTEGYVCVRKTIEEDIYAVSFDAINPPGTHHTLLTMGDPNAPDGIEACNAGANRTLSIFGSGVGTDPLDFPQGVALKIPKGTQILLNLHLFNTGTGVLSGTSGTRLRTIPVSQAANYQIAEGMLAGTIRLDLPPAQTTTTTGYCTMNMDATLFAVSQHMHMLGVYEKAVVERAAGGEDVLVDAPYKFDEQGYHSIAPVQVKKGDRVRVECTHNNTTAARVTFGESTLSEMCFAGLYRFPADGSNFMCIK